MGRFFICMARSSEGIRPTQDSGPRMSPANGTNLTVPQKTQAPAAPRSRGGRRSRKQLLRQFLPSLFPPIRLAVLPGRLWVDHPPSGRLQELNTDGKASAAERLTIGYPRGGAEITRKRGKRQVFAGLPTPNGNYASAAR